MAMHSVDAPNRVTRRPSREVRPNCRSALSYDCAHRQSALPTCAQTRRSGQRFWIGSSLGYQSAWRLDERVSQSSNGSDVLRVCDKPWGARVDAVRPLRRPTLERGSSSDAFGTSWRSRPRSFLVTRTMSRLGADPSRRSGASATTSSWAQLRPDWAARFLRPLTSAPTSGAGIAKQLMDRRRLLDERPSFL